MYCYRSTSIDSTHNHRNVEGLESQRIKEYCKLQVQRENLKMAELL
jgi:hypothetical protein